MHCKMIKIAEHLLNEIEKQMENLECVDTKELGEAIDMVKDLSEAIYYDVVTETMLDVEELGTDVVKKEKSGDYSGHSHHSRHAYMEAKEKHMDKAIQMRELEKYMQELTQDIVEMITDATPEEKQYLTKRITTLSNKISSLE